jgi:Ca-activated chloride channel homolog
MKRETLSLSSASTFMLTLLFLFMPELVSATTVQSYLRNREGVSKFKDKSYYPAYQSFLKALEEDPLNPELHLNLGLTFEANEEYEKSEQAYNGALKLIPPNSARRFEALFNLAGVLGKQSKIDEALGVYQAALDMYPESKEVKTNIELLWQQGQGGGKGKNQDKKSQKGDNKDQQQEGDEKDQKQSQKDKDGQDQPDKQDQKEQKKSRPFQSQELTPQDVKKILDEIKNQEQSIRAQEYERHAKEAPRGKDW